MKAMAGPCILLVCGSTCRCAGFLVKGLSSGYGVLERDGMNNVAAVNPFAVFFSPRPPYLPLLLL